MELHGAEIWHFRNGGSDAGKIMEERVLGPGETLFQLFLSEDMSFGILGAWRSV
jgi:hypothetical protein